MTEEEKIESNENLDNPGEYDSKSDYSKAEVTRNQVSKVKEVRSKEMKEGYYNTDKLGNKIYIPDSRKEFISAVIALRDLLEPEILRDSKFPAIEKEILKKKEEAIEKFGIYEMYIEGNRIMVDPNKPKYIPSLGEMVPLAKTITRKGRPIAIEIEYKASIFDRHHHNYWNYLVELYDRLDAELSSLIDRCNYFKEGISF